ncbi:hypothetical protein Droror1_Dr00004458 [Drosera rotundifolia]
MVGSKQGYGPAVCVSPTHGLNQTIRSWGLFEAGPASRRVDIVVLALEWKVEAKLVSSFNDKDGVEVLVSDGHRSRSGPGSGIPFPNPRSRPDPPRGFFFPLPSPPRTGSGDPREDSGNQ